MKDVVFCSVAFVDRRYLDQLTRLKNSIRDIYPKANMQFYRDAWPPNSRTMWDSLYGFKVHAIAEARKTFSKVCWLDPAMLLVSKIDRLMNFSMIAAIDDSWLHQTISDKYLKYKGLTREQVAEKKWHLVGGSFYYFNFDTIDAQIVFEDWAKDEREGYFGSQVEQASEQINSHRNDESCMAIAIYQNGLRPYAHDEVGYCVERDAIFRKAHFK